MVPAPPSHSALHDAVPPCEDLDLRDPMHIPAAGAQDESPAGTDDDDDELRRLVADHAHAAYRVALAVVRDPALAEDVVQETVVKVWRNLDQFRGEGSERGWVLRIAHNTAVSTLRTIRDVAHDPATMPETPTVVDAARRATGRVALEAMHEALRALDPLSRSIVVLREIEGMSYEDIADAVDVPVSTVKTRLFRARRELAIALEDWA